LNIKRGNELILEMKIKILLFGRLISVVGKKSIQLYTIGTECEVRDIKKIVFQMFPQIQKETFRIVVNQQICNDDHTVNEGDEIAFLPPISGGALCYLTKRKITQGLVKKITNFKDPTCGATLTFLGKIRKDKDSRYGKRFIEKIVYSAYEEMAEKQIDKIVNIAKEKFNVMHVFVKHRIGTVHVGEIAFLVVVFSSHRKEGINAIDYIIDEVKSKVPIWKKEILSDGIENWQDGEMIKSLK